MIEYVRRLKKQDSAWSVLELLRARRTARHPIRNLYHSGSIAFAGSNWIKNE